jgi:hypothetical protein
VAKVVFVVICLPLMVLGKWILSGPSTRKVRPTSSTVKHHERSLTDSFTFAWVVGGLGIVALYAFLLLCIMVFLEPVRKATSRWILKPVRDALSRVTDRIIGFVADT